MVELVDGLGANDKTIPPQHIGPGALGRTRAFVKVQDGCDNGCSFCITTIARGAGRSRSVGQIISEVQRLVDVGFHEVVLTGVHLGSYGFDRGVSDALPQLVEAILAETDVARLRLSSLEPWDLEPGFFDLWANERLCRQLHLPLQSGSDRVLQRMRRRTRVGYFSRLVTSARTRIPDLALTTDVIVGFPGEDTDAFEETCDFVEALQFARVHVFPYSPRPGTAAARMPGQVSKEVKVARSRVMRHLAERLNREYHSGFVGRTLPVLWEVASESGVWTGLTGNYLSVKTSTAIHLGNQITPTQLIAVKGNQLQGQIVSAD